MNFLRPVRKAISASIPLLACALLCSCANAEPPMKGAGNASAGVRTVSVQPRASSTTALTVASGSGDGLGVTLLATVNSKTGAPPVGSVVFTLQGKQVGQAAVRNGAASLTLESLPAGFSSLTASYEGDDRFLPSTSAPVKFYKDEQN